jgi:hypothetical protein
MCSGPLAGNIQAADAGASLGEAPGRLGISVSGAGDFNEDGFDDVIVGAWNNGGGGFRSGRAYTFFGPLAGTIVSTFLDSACGPTPVLGSLELSPIDPQGSVRKP